MIAYENKKNPFLVIFGMKLSLERLVKKDGLVSRSLSDEVKNTRVEKYVKGRAFLLPFFRR